MAFDSVVSDPLLMYGVAAGVAVVLIIIAALYVKKYLQHGPTREKNPGQKMPRLAYQPEARPIPAVQSKSIPRPVQKSPNLPKPREVSLLNGRADITQSLHGLMEKYSLDQFTIATSDGLVFASGGSDTAQTDAAQYGQMYAADPHSETPGVLLSGLTHKGSDLVLIIRTPHPVPEDTRQGIEKDTKDILNWWI
jgi:hypothetical protein